MLTPEILALLEVTGGAVECGVLSDVRPVVDLRAGLFPEQLELVACTAQRIAAHPSRRAGKTTGAVVRSFEAGLRHRDAVVPYLCLSGKSARRIAWPIISEMARRHSLGRVVDSDMTVRMDSGSIVICGGTDDREHIESLRGMKVGHVVVDECGSQRSSLLQTLDEDILHAACGDLRAAQVYVGTPPAVSGGYFDAMIDPAKVRGRHPIFHWDVRANPYFHDPVGWLRETVESRRWQWTEMGHPTTTPKFAREYLGLRCVDVDALVMPFDPLRNQIAALPAVNSRGTPLTPDGWSLMLSSDLGHVSALAIVAMATHRHDQRTYFVSAEKHQRWIADQWGERIRRLRDGGLVIPVANGTTLVSRPERTRLVADLGGLGSEHAERVRRKFGLLIEAADKRERESSLRFFRDELSSGLVQLLEWDLLDVLREEWSTLGWNDDQTDVEEGSDDHAHDAAMYAHGMAAHHQRDKASRAKPGSSEWYAEEARRLEQHAEQRARRAGLVTAGRYR